MSSKLSNTYLTAYNILSLSAWGFVLYTTLVHLITFPAQAPRMVKLLARPTVVPAAKVLARATKLYEKHGEMIKYVQSAAVLEVVHAALGLVRSPVLITAAQIASRLFLVWVIMTYKNTQTNPIYALMVIAWATSEIIRFSFYLYSCMGRNAPSWLKWLRYTAFFALYPIGASSEAWLIYSTLPSPSLGMGNWTIPQLARGVAFLVWWPALGQMMSYMISQRYKVIGAGNQLSDKKRQ